MPTVCGFPVKSTWLKAVAAGNYVGWSMLTIRIINKYYPETNKTSKGHLNQTQKNVQLTKPMETCNMSSLCGKKKRDVHTTIYNVREDNSQLNQNKATNTSW
jgi:hypothetical protein